MCAKIVKNKSEAQQPLILRCHRLMDAFAKSDDERDFYIDHKEGFLIYVDLDKPTEELVALEKEISAHPEHYFLIPKLSFYETKKIMEGFVNEKVYDIDTKEKLLDIIQSKEAKENFLEFIYDHLSELEKWQQYYQERSRIRMIEWLRQNNFDFVFEEDLDLPRLTVEKLKKSIFEKNVDKDVSSARKVLVMKAKTYYSNEALNPRPKRGRPPKQVAKAEFEPQVTGDIYTTVHAAVHPFLFIPEPSTTLAFSAFSSKFETEQPKGKEESLSQKLAALRTLSKRWVELESLELTKDQEKKNQAAVSKKEPPKAALEGKKEARKQPKRLAAAKIAKTPAKPKPKRIIPIPPKAQKPGKKQPLKKIMPRKK